jgi:hypothetical protein
MNPLNRITLFFLLIILGSPAFSQAQPKTEPAKSESSRADGLRKNRHRIWRARAEHTN